MKRWTMIILVAAMAIFLLIVGAVRLVRVAMVKNPLVENDKHASAPATPTLQLCASNGEYDFSNLDIKKVGRVEFTARPDCWIKVSLPLTGCVTHDPVVEVQRVWDDGAKDVDGPNRIVQPRTGRIIFVKALQKEGIYKIITRS